MEFRKYLIDFKNKKQKPLPFDAALDIVKKAAKENNLEAKVIFPKNKFLSKGSRANRESYKELYKSGWNTANVMLKNGLSRAKVDVTGVPGPNSDSAIVFSIMLIAGMLFKEKSVIQYKEKVSALAAEYAANN